MKILNKYMESIVNIINKVENTQMDNMKKTSTIMATAIKNKNKIYTFGTNHAGILAQELYYRTGGLAVINYINAPGLALDVTPPTLTTDIERLDGYGKAIVNANKIEKDDIIIIHSVSGRNSVTIDVAIESKNIGAKTIALTNLSTSTKLPSRHKSGKSLHEVCDLVIDNCGDYGDATLSIENFPEKVAPSSTAVGAVILNAIVADVIDCLVKDGYNPPVFISSNLPEGDKHNKDIMEAYKDMIIYL